ncbi:MAG TPA: GGDEF domain-containing phosphodiesterase [Gammaproteobacteria bacterium]
MAAGRRASASTRFIDQFLQQASHRLIGLLLGQLDAFNRISATFGEDRSQRFCSDYVEGMKALLPPGAPIIRLSGRRFIVLLPLDSAGAVLDAAARLTEDDRARVQVGDDSFVVDLTLGVAVYPTHAEDAASLFRRAELALKEARENELGFAVYSPDSTRRQTALWKLESDFERAVQQGKLDVYFQPKIALGDRRVLGVEALARWRSPSGTFVPPQQFVPLAERSGSIVPMTWLVLDKVLETAATWSPFAPFSIAVNVAPQVLTHPDFFSRLQHSARSLEESGLGLTLELTEESLVSGDGASIPSLERVRKLGIGVAIDDFGKGYSSLSYLKEIPATEVKIDKRFVATAATDEKDRHIVRVIVELARAFGMTVVAEGVDSPYNLETVAELGCDAAQGFFIARPMRAGVTGDWIAHLQREAARWPASRPAEEAPGPAA